MIYYKADTEFPIGKGVVYTEFYEDIAIRQINIAEDKKKFSISSSLEEWNEDFGYLLYDGKKAELDLSGSFEITSKEFEQQWSYYNHIEPAKIKYSYGDASIVNRENVVIAHIVNNLGYWGKGFVNALSFAYPLAKDEYKTWYEKSYNIPFQLGETQFVEVDTTRRVVIANMLAQNGVRKSVKDKRIYVDYNALEKCLYKLSFFCLVNRYAVQMPKIGAGLAGGSWNDIEKIIERTLLYYRINVEVKIFDINT